jgi:hypothetical protein
MMRWTLLSALMLALPGQAAAGLLGQVVTVGYDFFGTTSSDNVMVGAGVEMTCPSGGFGLCTFLTSVNQHVDIGDTSISYSYDGAAVAFFSAGAGFNGFKFSGLMAGGGPISGVTLNTNISGLTTAQLSSTGDTIDLDMNGRSIANGSFFTLSFTYVPEPATGLVALAGLAGLLLVRRRQ